MNRPIDAARTIRRGRSTSTSPSSARRHSPLLREQLQSRAAGLSADDQSLDAAQLRAMVLSHRDWLEVNNRRELHRHGWRQLFAEFDVVVCPITPTPAFVHEHDPGHAIGSSTHQQGDEVIGERLVAGPPVTSTRYQITPNTTSTASATGTSRSSDG